MSAAGQQLFFGALAPGFMDLSPGYTYCVAFINPTGANIVTGSYKFQDADADPANPCAPLASSWADLEVEPECDALPGTVAGPAAVLFNAQNPLPANSQCQYAVPCPRRFVRVEEQGTGGTAVVIGMVGRLRRTGMQGIAA
jgi:hypothetical protein